MRDGFLIVGTLLIGAGCWLYHPGAAFITVGGLLLTLGVASFFWPAAKGRK